VLYRNANPAENTRDSKPEFVITNAGSAPVPLDAIELFYWFNDDTGQPFVFHCDWAQIGCANILGEFQTSHDGSHYLRLHFRTGLEPLQPGQDTGEIKIASTAQIGPNTTNRMTTAFHQPVNTRIGNG
jgi:endoglucanase